jgi:hypothetical protein
MNCGRCDNTCTPGIACSTGVCQQVACAGPPSLTPLPITSPDTLAYPLSVTADLNGDGKLDLIALDDHDGSITTLLGNGDGTFSPGISYPTQYASTPSIVVGDFDEDGIPDLAMSVPMSAPDWTDTVDVWFGNGDGSLSNLPTYYGAPASDIFVGDANGDGHLDIVKSNGLSTSIVVLLGWGDGTFSKSGDFSTGESVRQVVIRDWDGDGTPDLLAMGTTLHLLLGTGSGKFAKQLDCQVAVAPTGQTVIADFNQDGKQDVATILDGSNSISVMLGDGRCGLTARTDYATSGSPEFLVSGDVNGDGILDLVEMDRSHSAGHLVTLVGRGDGTFVPSPELTVPLTGGGIMIGDFNGDGRADVLICTDDGAEVRLNTCK